MILDLFLCYLQIGLFSIGGGYAALPLIQSQVVERYGWLTLNEFSDMISIAEMTPGPMAVNSATFVGNRLAGIPGAAAATFGCILPSCFIVSFLYFIYARYKELSLMKSILAALRPVVVALIASAFLSLLKGAVMKNGVWAFGDIRWLSAALFLISFVLIRKLKWPGIPVMVGCGLVFMLLNVIIT